MRDLEKMVGTWVVVAGFVLSIAVLYWGQAVIVPVALAVLLTFLLAPPVTWLQRWIGRLPAVLVLVVLAFSIFGAAGWGLMSELSSLANELPGYRANIRQKIVDIRGVGTGGSMEKVQQTLSDIQTEITRRAPLPAAPVRPVLPPPEETQLGISSLWIEPLFGPLATAGLVVVLVIFMLLERQQLRDRLIRLFGYRHLAVITRAFDDAATRISRYLLVQSMINLTFGTGVAIGLKLIGVPYALLWGGLAAVLRFIPYVGAWMGAAGPILVGLAALPGWSGVGEVIGLFIGLELMTNMVLEPVLYAGAAGVSQVALLIAIAFWTWLWGPLGLLLATPMTVCLVVLGTHVPGLEFLATVLADAPALTPDVRYYQRLLARDQSEAADMLEAYVKREPPATVYDALLLPALNYAERDRFDDQLSDEEERAVIEATRELIDDLTVRPSDPGAAPAAARGDGSQPIHVFGCAANSESDALALRMLNELVREGGMVVDVPSVRLVASELIDAVRAGGYRVICIADLPPSAPSKTRYLIKRLRASLPELKITVGRWAPPSVADETLQPLREAGADHASATLIQTRDALLQLAAALPPAGAQAPRAVEAPPRRLHPA